MLDVIHLYDQEMAKYGLHRHPAESAWSLADSGIGEDKEVLRAPRA